MNPVNSKPKGLLHLNSYFSTSGLFKELYDRQEAYGLPISVYVPIAEEYPEDRLAAKGDYSQVVRPFKERDRYIFHLKHQKIWRDLKQRYHFEDYGLVHAHSLFSNGWLAWKVKQHAGLPYVVAVRNTDVRTFFRRMPWMRPIGLNILREAERIVFISRNTYQEVFGTYIPEADQAQLAAKTLVIPNGIGDFWHEETHVQTRDDLHEPLRIISVGKVMKLKRFPQLAEMTANYSKPVELHIVGPEWEDGILANLQAYPHVTYHGAKTPQELRELYRTMDIYAMLSSPETFGLVYVEAMSQGLPVIYTAGEGFDSFYPNHTVGVSVDKADEAGLHQALDYIQSHYDKLSSQAVQASGDFRWNEIHEQYLSLYREIV